ncbi:MAG TPA: SDR family oxidoreductase [Thermoanaerobaculia bacterium]|nr:SDR family oxidoreductase [Thermoanaerobaculia bacterium]
MKTLLVTGGTGQLGQAMLERLNRDYRCVVVTRTEFPKVDRFYGILHLAGAFTVGSAPDDFMKMLDANLMSAVRVIEPMREKIEDGGRIIGISSLASQTTPAGLAAYVSAKAALNAYIGVLAKDLQPRRITANALLPSALATPTMLASMPREKLIPLDRVAETVAFLLSDAGASITGQLIAMTP